MPNYTIGEIIIFPQEKYNDSDLSLIITDACEYDIDYSYDVAGCILVKVPIGYEDSVGKKIISQYPEFLQSYCRRDLEEEKMVANIDKLKFAVDNNLLELVGQKKFDVKKWNDALSQIANIVQSMKK